MACSKHSYASRRRIWSRTEQFIHQLKLVGLESYLLENAADNVRRLIVFTGPVFNDADPVYRGVDIPVRYFKVAVFLQEGVLAATGYVVDQTPQLADLDDVPKPGAVGDGAPPFGAVPDLPGPDP